MTIISIAIRLVDSKFIINYNYFCRLIRRINEIINYNQLSILVTHVRSIVIFMRYFFTNANAIAKIMPCTLKIGEVVCKILINNPALYICHLVGIEGVDGIYDQLQYAPFLFEK